MINFILRVIPIVFYSFIKAKFKLNIVLCFPCLFAHISFRRTQDIISFDIGLSLFLCISFDSTHYYHLFRVF